MQSGIFCPYVKMTPDFQEFSTLGNLGVILTTGRKTLLFALGEKLLKVEIKSKQEEKQKCILMTCVVLAMRMNGEHADMDKARRRNV